MNIEANPEGCRRISAKRFAFAARRDSIFPAPFVMLRLLPKHLCILGNSHCRGRNASRAVHTEETQILHFVQDDKKRNRSIRSERTALSRSQSSHSVSGPSPSSAR